MKLLEQVLADARGELPVLRKHGQDAIADAIARLCDEIAEAAEPFTRWLSEKEAVLGSDHAAPWFRQRFAAWERQGLARWSPRNKQERQYLACIVPQRADVRSARQDGVRAARGESAA